MAADPEFPVVKDGGIYRAAPNHQIIFGNFAVTLRDDILEIHVWPANALVVSRGGRKDFRTLKIRRVYGN